MSGLMFKLEDYFHFLAERSRAGLACRVCRRLSAVFAFFGDVVHAAISKPRHF